MEQDTVVVMIDEEMDRLRQVRDILASLLPDEQRLEPLLDSAVQELEESAAAEPSQEQETKTAPEVPRLKSRRGIRTGPRGPRARKTVVEPRALDSFVPSAPVVVVKPAPRVAVAAPPVHKQVKAAPVDKLDSLLAAAFANM